MRRRVTLTLGLTVLLGGCPEPEPEADPEPAGCSDVPCDRLSDYGLSDEVRVSYEPIARLWSDGSLKSRSIVLPEGETVGFDPGEVWDWPTGTILVKEFAFVAPVETRLLVLGEEGWEGFVYLWREDGSDADLFLPGTRVDVQNDAGEPQEYVVPSQNHCVNCHARDDVVHLLGPFTAQLNHQLDALAPIFDAPPPDPATLDAFSDPFGDGPLDERARSWLHANCSHCHRPGGNGGSSGLTFLFWEDDPASFGVCKRPAAAGAGTGGRSFDIVPGAPEESIVMFRMESTDPAVKMPELPNLIPDPDGVALIRAWIASMPPEECE